MVFCARLRALAGSGEEMLHRMRSRLAGVESSLALEIEGQAASPDYSRRRRVGAVLGVWRVKGCFGRGAGRRPPFPQVGGRLGVADFELAEGQLVSHAGSEKARTCSLTRQ